MCICIAQIQPRKLALNHADHAAPIGPHELRIIGMKNLNYLKYLHHEAGIGYLDHDLSVRDVQGLNATGAPLPCRRFDQNGL